MKELKDQVTRRTQLKNEIRKVGLKQEDASNEIKCQKGVKKMVMRCVATSIHGETPH